MSKAQTTFQPVCLGREPRHLQNNSRNSYKTRNADLRAGTKPYIDPRHDQHDIQTLQALGPMQTVTLEALQALIGPKPDKR